MNATDTFMNRFNSNKSFFRLCALFLLASASLLSLTAQPTNPVAVLKISADQVAAKVSPKLYGLMTEEINYSYDGGLYAELVRNRTFKGRHQRGVLATGAERRRRGCDVARHQPAAQHRADDELEAGGGQGRTATGRGHRQRGFRGIPVTPKTKYQASFYARADKGFSGPLTVAIVSSNGATTFASAEVRNVTGEWKKYEVTLKTGKVAPSKDNRLVITTTQPGTIWFSQVSLFPPTFNRRPNGNRPDIMQLLADMHPAFLRFPGGNYVEGNTFATRFDWKKTIGDISQRPGHFDDAWRYWSTDGMGLLEFLGWCEDLKMQPVLAVYAGFPCGRERLPTSWNSVCRRPSTKSNT